ncbi:hypothetical protein BKA93DRAFT_729128, partial [Sparassis latifolia]
ALLLFEHAITLSDEIDYIWRCKKTGVTALFISNRFFGLVLAVSMVVSITPWHSNPWFDLSHRHQQCAAFSALRVYAVGGRAWLPAGIVFLLSLVPFATNLVLYADVCNSNYLPHYTSCSSCLIYSLTVSITTRASLSVADIIVLMVTWMKTYKIKKYTNSAHIEAPMVTLLLRDG